MPHWDECETCQQHERPGVVHVYGQEHEHDDAYIVADVKALELLRDAINTALDAGRGKAIVTPSDGEGYVIHVVRHDTDRIDVMKMPYTSYNPNKGRPPESLIPYHEEEVILGDDDWFKVMKEFMSFDYRTGKNVENESDNSESE